MSNKHIANHGISNEKRAKHDYYSTPPEVVEYLLKVETFNKNILEPCIGGGQ